MKKLIGLVTPFKRLSKKEKMIGTVGLVAFIFLLWSTSGHNYLPTPLEILGAFPKLISQKDVFWHFQKSIAFCFKCMGYSILAALTVAYISRLPLFEGTADFMRKFRFLPSTGLSFFFMKLTGSVDSQMTAMMIFGITTWLIDSMVGIALSITDDQIMYARSLRLSRWQTMYQVLILGKAAEMFSAVISNFAMAWLLLASIENIAKASGGIGVILSESNKYFKMEEVYAIQFMILFTGILIDYSLRKVRSFLFPYTALTE